jgi:ABC-type multidrug transport system ATPase subunit
MVHPAIQFSTVSKKYSTDDDGLHEINFEVGPGSMPGLTGPNGAGMTQKYQINSKATSWLKY